MSIHILVLIIVVTILLSIRKKITNLSKSIENKMEVIKAFITHPSVVATSIGKILLDQVSTKFSKIFKR